MIAPSEKHLEDWIVNNLQEFKEAVHLPIRRLVARQQVLPSGRSDLIMAMICNLTVFELKKGEINSQTMAQLFRYIGDLRNLHTVFYGPIYSSDNVLAHNRSMEQLLQGRYPIHGIVIGHSVTEHALSICRSFNLETILYDYDGHNYTFERDPYTFEHEWDGIDTRDLSAAMKELMRHLKLYDEDKETLISIFKSEGSR